MSENEYNELSEMLDLSSAINYLETIAQSISSAYQSLNLGELVEIYETYATFGWTIPPAMTYFAKQKATTLEDADAFMLQFCSSEDMVRIFSDLRNHEKIDKNDLEEAINCYNQKYYKACSLLLLSMVDGILIKLQQQKTNPSKKEYRTVNKANSQLKEKSIKKSTFICLQSIITTSCVIKIYESPEDFTKKYSFVNRDTFVHGMVTHFVVKTDCIKVFLLLYNILRLLKYQNITELKNCCEIKT